MNRSMIISSGLVLIGVLALGVTAQQQSQQWKAVKLQNASWCEIRTIDFKPGQRDAALKIITEHFDPARESAGLPQITRYEYATGAGWDIVTVFPMPGGPAEMEWDIDPEMEKWMAALAQQVGGMDKANALRQEYMALIARTDSQLAFNRAPEVKAAAKHN